MPKALPIIILLLPVVAVGQDLPDKDCGDFNTRMQAQGTYLAAQQLTGQKDDHGLDRDGDGVACESIVLIQRDSLARFDSAYTETVPRTSVVACSDTSFTLQDFIEETRRGFWGSGVAKGWQAMMDCVHLHLVMEKSMRSDK